MPSSSTAKTSPRTSARTGHCVLAILVAAFLAGIGGGAHSHGGGGGRSFGRGFPQQMQATPLQDPRTRQKSVKQVKPLPLNIHDKWAVLVGISHYQDSGVKPLKYASKNVLTLTEGLCDPQAGHFLPDHVLVATEEKVTKEALADSTWQNWLSKKALPNDLVLLYFCMRFVPTDDASDILLLTEESKTASKETSATSLSSLLGEVRRRTQSKNIIALLELSPTEHTAKSFPYGFGTLLQSIGQKSGVTIFSADDRVLGSLEDVPARTSFFAEYISEGIKAGGGAMATDAIAGFVSQVLANQPPARGEGYNSHPILLIAAENPELVKIPLGLHVKNPNSVANFKVGHPLSEIAQTDPALAAHLAQLEENGSPLQKLQQMKRAEDEVIDQKEDAEGAATGQDVDFAPYMATMKKTILGKWLPPKGLDLKNVVTVFNIQKDGSITDPEIVESSGSAPIDQSALKALAEASPLAPLPKGSPRKIQIRYKFDWKAAK